MNVKELSALLSKYDPATRVLVDGYEEGFSDLSEKNIRLVRFTENYGPWVNVSHSGPHIERADGDQSAVVLGRG